MFVCICNSITDKQIRKSARKGVGSLYELREDLGVASACGNCAEMAQTILDEEQSNHFGPQLFVPSSA